MRSCSDRPSPVSSWCSDSSQIMHLMLTPKQPTPFLLSHMSDVIDLTKENTEFLLILGHFVLHGCELLCPARMSIMHR